MFTFSVSHLFQIYISIFLAISPLFVYFVVKNWLGMDFGVIFEELNKHPKFSFGDFVLTLSFGIVVLYISIDSIYKLNNNKANNLAYIPLIILLYYNYIHLKFFHWVSSKDSYLKVFILFSFFTFIFLSGYREGQSYRYDQISNFKNKPVCQSNIILMKLGSNYLAAKSNSSRVILDDKCKEILII